jgi:hypothetical protein
VASAIPEVAPRTRTLSGVEAACPLAFVLKTGVVDVELIGVAYLR